MFVLENRGSGSNLGNLDFHQSVTDFYQNLVSEFSYLKDLDDVDSFNISVVDGGKETEQVK